MVYCHRASIARWNSLVISACLFAPTASVADGVCSQWDVSGSWSFRQSNDTGPVLQLEQTASEFHGTASYNHSVDDDYCIGVACDHQETVRGMVVGTVKVDVFEATVYWDNHAIGVYSGSVGPQGLIAGSTFDATNPQTKANWHSNRFFKCLSNGSADSSGGLASTPNQPGAGAPANSLPPVALGRVSTRTTAAPLPICESARNARARNSPAAPGLERQCAAQSSKPALPVLDDASRDKQWARGEALASEDPLAAELRNSIPEGKPRDGFDYGMAVAEGHTANGPGKQARYDALNPDEQFGFELAVLFSVERNANADLAGKGAAIMVADPTVAAVRDSYAAAIAERSGAADRSAFYKLGFDIATGLFGDPDLGAAGNTLMGPGSLKVRSSLAPGTEQLGFDDAVSFHLKRDYQ